MSWNALIGHEAQVRLFRQVAERGRLAHAYVFLGPEGIGKRSFAVELAKALNCEESARALRLESCDACASCRLIDSGNHPDVETLHLPEGRHEFPIEDIRALIGRINLKPARGGRRTVIVDDAAAFSVEAANAFLKTLEEPPPHSLLVLIGQQADHFLATIISRCQVLRFRPLAAENIVRLLLDRGIVKSKAEAQALADQAEGSLGLARILADPAVQAFRKEWLAGYVGSRLDSVELADRLTKFVEEAGTESADKRARAQLVIRLLLEILDQALASISGQDVKGNPLAERLGSRLGQRRLLELMDRTLEAEQQVNRYLQLVLVLEALTDALCRPLLTPTQ